MKITTSISNPISNPQCWWLPGKSTSDGLPRGDRMVIKCDQLVQCDQKHNPSAFIANSLPIENGDHQWITL